MWIKFIILSIFLLAKAAPPSSWNVTLIWGWVGTIFLGPAPSTFPGTTRRHSFGGSVRFCLFLSSHLFVLSSWDQSLLPTPCLWVSWRGWAFLCGWRMGWGFPCEYLGLSCHGAFLGHLSMCMTWIASSILVLVSRCQILPFRSRALVLSFTSRSTK